MTETHRVCRTCGEDKPITSYSPKKRCLGGYHPSCKACVNAAYRAKHPPKEGQIPVRPRDYAVQRTETDRGTVLVQFGDRHKTRIEGEYSRGTTSSGTQSSMRMFDLEG